MAEREQHYDWVGNCRCVGQGSENFHKRAQLNLLTDISESLQEIASILCCRKFRDIPFKLDAIKSNTAKKPKVTKLKRVA